MNRHVASVALLLAFAVAGSAGCSPSSSTTTAGSQINVTLDDFGVVASQKTVPAGVVVLHVTNKGPSTHEINVDLTRYGSGYIPLQRDGLTANEDALGLHRINSIEQLNLHQTADLTLNLKPGRYVLWCNLEGHYLGGMYEVFNVVDGGHR